MTASENSPGTGQRQVLPILLIPNRLSPCSTLTNSLPESFNRIGRVPTITPQHSNTVSGTLRIGEPTPQAATPLARAYSAEPTNVSTACWLAASTVRRIAPRPTVRPGARRTPDRDRNSQAVAMMTAYDPFLSHSRPAGIGKLDPAIVLLLATGSQRPWLGHAHATREPSLRVS